MSDSREPDRTAADAMADDLYSLDPDEFVAARDRLVATLRQAGEPVAAKMVKSLRRPTVAAWAVNQVVRTAPEKVDELLAVTRELEDAQREALAGKRGDLRSLSARRQMTMDELAARAARLIDDRGGSSSAHRDDIVRTLQAATDPELADQLREGRLTAALEPVSALAGLTAWFEESGAAEVTTDRDSRRRLERAVEAAKEELSEAERELQEAQAEADDLRTELDRTTKRIEKLTRTSEQRRTKLEEARRALSGMGRAPEPG